MDTVNRSKTDPGHEFPWEELLTDLVKWDKERKEVKPMKKDLDIAQRWIVDNGIMRDENGMSQLHVTRWLGGSLTSIKSSLRGINK